MTLTCLKSQKCNIEWRWVILSSVRDHDSCWEEIQNGLNVHYHQRLNLRGQEIRVSSTFSLHILTLTLRTTHMKFSTIKEISLPWKPEWGDKVKHAGKHMEPIDRKVKHIAEIRAKFQEHIIHNFFFENWALGNIMMTRNGWQFLGQVVTLVFLGMFMFGLKYKKVTFFVFTRGVLHEYTLCNTLKGWWDSFAYTGRTQVVRRAYLCRYKTQICRVWTLFKEP